MRFRQARLSDIKDISRFCINTFSWGDYIPKVVETWYRDSNGMLFVAEYRERHKISEYRGHSIATVGVSHVALCPRKKLAWIEGIRIHPDYRRVKVATGLIQKMLGYAKKQQIKQISAIVALDNTASQSLLKKNGFEMISKWGYYSYKKNKQATRKTNARIASPIDINNIWDYLKNSKIYKLSAKRYVDAWRWYTLDRNILTDFVKQQRLIVTGNRIINGIMILNESQYLNKSNILQIVYLDSMSKSSLENLVSFAINLLSINTTIRFYSSKYYSRYDSSSCFKQLQILGYQTEGLSLIMKSLNIKVSEEFLLYHKSIKI